MCAAECPVTAWEKSIAHMNHCTISDITLVGEASSGEQALVLVESLAPDIVLMDVEMPAMDGIAATAAMRTSTSQSAVVMLSIHDDVHTRARARAAGAAAFVEKSGTLEVLLATIRQTA